MKKALIKAFATAAIAVPLALAVAGSSPGSDTTLRAASESAPRYTTEQRAAVRRAYQAQAHPQWRTLSTSARVDRLMMFGQRMMKSILATGGSDPAVAAAFQGNQTLIKGPSGQAIELQRQADCSLSYSVGNYTLSLTAPTIQVLSTTANYQNVLHAAAGLTTTANAFPHGCAEATLGIGSRRGMYLGRTNQNLYMFASSGYDYAAGSDALYYGTVDAASQTVHSFNTDLSVQNISGMTAGDLNGDGLADVAALDLRSGNVTVWLAHADGTLGAPTTYAAAGTRGLAAVMADVNGDGKVDLVVAGSTFNAATSRDDQTIAVLLGRGDGTFEAARTFAVTSPSATFNALPTTMVATDLRGTGRPDIVASNGLVLLNDGNGGFTQSSTWAFPVPNSSNAYGPNLVAGDFNEDGKPDIAINDGSRVQVMLGRGDGTFALGRAYANSDSVGYMTASDLDGDGHLDLYIGLANGGFFGGDQYGVNQGYVLMGKGDGSFAGAPVLPFVYNGHNMVDLNHDGVLDAVGVNPDRSFTSYIGDGQGGYTAQSTLSVATVTLGGQTFSVSNIDSFDLADVNGDGNVDLVFVSRDFNARNSPSDFYSSGVLIALGDGHGGFAAPVFMPAPSFLAAGDIDINLQLTNVRLADVNGDGKADLVYAYADTSYSTNQRSVGTAVQLGNGDGTFQAPKTFLFYTAPDNGSFINYTSEVEQFTDLNGDGKLDLLMVTQTSTLDTGIGGYRSNIQVALGHGDGTFSAPTTVPGPDVLAHHQRDTLPTPMTLVDVNGDGLLDLVVLGGTASYGLQVAIALGNGDGTFRTPSRTNFSAQYLGNGQQLAVADFNNDGKPDVVIANPYGITGIALGAGDGTLAPLGTGDARTPNLLINVPVSGATRVLDFNHDGKPDVLIGDTLLMSTSAAPAAAAEFRLASDSSTATLKAGQSVQTNVTVTPGSGFSGTVTFSCAGLPTGAACNFSPPSLPVNGAAGSTSLTITTTAAASFGALWGIDPRLPGSMMLAGLIVLACTRRRQIAVALRRPALIALMAAGGLALSSCGGSDSGSANGGGGDGGSGTPVSTVTAPGSYTIVITASDGTLSRSVNYTLVVN